MAAAVATHALVPAIDAGAHMTPEFLEWPPSAEGSPAAEAGCQPAPAALLAPMTAPEAASAAGHAAVPKGLAEEEWRTHNAAGNATKQDRMARMVEERIAAGGLHDRLQGKVFVVVLPGFARSHFVYERARQLGVRTVIVDMPGSWAQSLVAEGLAEKFVPLEMASMDAAFEPCLNACLRIKQELGRLDAVTAFAELAQALAGRLAAALGLPGKPRAALATAQNKVAMRAFLEAAGQPMPRNVLVQSPDELEQAARHVGFPAVLKPITGAASFGVLRVNDEAQLRAGYARVHSILDAANFKSGHLMQGSSNQGSGNAHDWIRCDVMLEEYLLGREVAVDVVMAGGAPAFVAVNDLWEACEPWFRKIGRNTPSSLAEAVQSEIAAAATSVLRDLGFTDGVFQVQYKATAAGPRLIEVNTRMGGGANRLRNLLRHGVDMVEESLLAAAGLPPRAQAVPAVGANMAELFVHAPLEGTLRDTSFLDKWQEHPDVLYAGPLVPPGAQVMCGGDAMPTLLCQALVIRPTLEEAMKFVWEVHDDIIEHLVIEPNAEDARADA